MCRRWVWPELPVPPEGASPPTSSSRTQTSVPSSWLGNGLQPNSQVLPSRATQGQPVPPADQPAAVHRAGGEVSPQVWAAAWTDAQSVLLVAPGYDIDAGDTRAERLPGGHVAACGERIPIAGRSVLGSF